jgi:hypothetical protein
MLPYAEIHRNMNTRKHSLSRAISSNIQFFGQCTLMAREQVMSDQEVTGLHVTTFLPCGAAIIKRDIVCTG